MIVAFYRVQCVGCKQYLGFGDDEIAQPDWNEFDTRLKAANAARELGWLDYEVECTCPPAAERILNFEHHVLCRKITAGYMPRCILCRS